MKRVLFIAIVMIVAGLLVMVSQQFGLYVWREDIKVSHTAPVVVIVPIGGVPSEQAEIGHVENQDQPTTTASIAQIRGRSGSGVYTNEKYGFQIKFPDGWSYFEQEKRNGTTSVSLLQFVPVPEGMPWGDSFGGFIGAHGHVTNFQEWFEKNAKFSSEDVEEMIQATAEIYGEAHWSANDFESEYEEIKVDGHDAIVQKTRCLKEDCYFLGTVRGHQEEWFIYKEPTVVTVRVLTYNPVEQLGSILASFKFLK